MPFRKPTAGYDRKGEKNGNAKLTADQVRAIRADPRTLAAIASDYGVHRVYISDIKRRRVWRHLPEAAARLKATQPQHERETRC